VAEVQNLEEEAQSEELRVDCYEAIALCMRAAEQAHHRLMHALMVRHRRRVLRVVALFTAVV
jgi:hypothetical protein